MFALFGDVKALFKLESTATDNVVFRLHYKVTVIILIACSILVTSKTYIGDPIDCIVEEIPSKVSVLNLYSNFQNEVQTKNLMKYVVYNKVLLVLRNR